MPLTIYLAFRKRLLLIARGRFFVIRRFNCLLLIDILNYVDRQVEAFGLYEPSQLRGLNELIRHHRITTFMDIGAHWGLYSLFLASRPVSSLVKIEAFEPDPTNYRQLNANIFLNPRLIPISSNQCALSDRKCLIPFSCFQAENRGRSSVDPASSGLVKAITLDSHCGQMQGQRCALKIDVEGHELCVLRGARQTLASNSCIVQVEVKQENVDSVLGFFESLEYSLVSVRREDYLFVSPSLRDSASGLPRGPA